VLAVALALTSSVVWGTADFLGGVFTRRLRLAPVLIVSQLAGLVLLAAAAAITRDLDAHAFAVGLAAGACGAVGIAAFYRALATGTISIVSPVSALFTAAATRGYLSIVSVLGSEHPVVTVILAQALLGERVSRPQAAGITLALAGVAIVAVN
jgi:drug/metabolite transporter (DMT)-like permease